MFDFLGEHIFSGVTSSFGIDVSDLSVKVVQVKRSRFEDEVCSFGASKIPPGSITDGEIIQPDIVSRAILEALASASPRSMKPKQVYCSLPENKAFVRIVEMPEISDSEIGEALKWEIEENIPLGIDQIYFDWKVLEKKFNPNSNRMQVLVVAVSRTIVDSYGALLEGIGLEPIGMEVESLAQAHALMPDGVQGATLIMDIGDRKTSLLFSVDETVCFTSSISVSAQMITDAIAKAFGISLEEAEAMKLEKGIGSFVQKDMLFEAVESILENLISQIRFSVDFFINSLRYRPQVDRVLLCGGGANTKGLIGYLAKRIGREVIKGDTWASMRFQKRLPIIPREESIKYATAVGLALRGFEENSKNI